MNVRDKLIGVLLAWAYFLCVAWGIVCVGVGLIEQSVVSISGGVFTLIV